MDKILFLSSLVVVVILLFLFYFIIITRKQSIVEESWKELYLETIHREIDPITSLFLANLSPQQVSHFLQQYRSESSLTLLQQRNIVITGLMRNCRSNVANLRSWFDHLCSLTRHHLRLVILENNSTDGTRHELYQWSTTNPENVHVLCPDGTVSSPVCHTPWIHTRSEHSKSPILSRIRTMARLRRIYHQYILTSMSPPDYVLVMDLDLVGTLYTDGLAQSLTLLEKKKGIDAIACNGRYYHPKENHPYYDSFAYQGINEPLGFKTHKEKIDHDFSVIRRMTLELTRDMSTLHPVRSAFGGACLYRWDAFQKHSYTEPPIGSTRLVCEHALFHQGMKMVINPCFVFLIYSNP